MPKKIKVKLRELQITSRELGKEIFAKELVDEMLKLDVRKKYSPSEIARLYKKASKKANKRLKEIR